MERRRFTREFKLEAVKLIEERGVSLRARATFVCVCTPASGRRFKF